MSQTRNHDAHNFLNFLIRVHRAYLPLLPGLPVGMLLGEYLHRRVDERRFKLAVYVLLVLAAIALLVR